MHFIITPIIQQALTRLLDSENCTFPSMRGSRWAAKWRSLWSRCNTTSFKSILRCDPFAICLSFGMFQIRPLMPPPLFPAPRMRNRLISPNTLRRIRFSRTLTTICNNFIALFSRRQISNWITETPLEATGMPTFISCQRTVSCLPMKPNNLHPCPNNTCLNRSINGILKMSPEVVACGCKARSVWSPAGCFSFREAMHTFEMNGEIIQTGPININPTDCCRHLIRCHKIGTHQVRAFPHIL